MDWILFAIGAFLVWLAVDIIRLQSNRANLPMHLQDEMIFGKTPISDQQRNWIKNRFYYGASSSKFLAVAAAAAGIGFLGLAFSAV